MKRAFLVAVSDGNRNSRSPDRDDRSNPGTPRLPEPAVEGTADRGRSPGRTE